MNIKTRLFILVGFGLLFFAWLFFLIYSRTIKPPLPILLRTDPPNGSTNASSVAPVVLTFDTPINPKLISLSSQPPVNWSVSQIQSTNIQINHDDYLQSSTKYSLSLYYDNNLLSELVFTTAGGQGDPNYYQQVQREMDRDYPLATSFPYETSAFRVVYSAPLTLELTLKSFSLSQEEALSQLKSYVKRNGGDPATHTYTIVPLASPEPSAEAGTPADDSLLDEFTDEE